MKRLGYRLGLGLALAVPAASSRADWSALETFDSLTAGQPVNQAGSGWTQGTGATTRIIPNGPGNALLVENATGTGSNVNPVYKALGSLAVPASSTSATVFTQFALTQTGVYNFNIGLSDLAAPPGTAGEYEAQFNFSNVGTDSTFFRARTLASFIDLTSVDSTVQADRNAGRIAPTPFQTFNLWFVIDNSSDTYAMYLQSPDVASLASPTLMRRADNNTTAFTFRNSGNADGSSNNPLSTFLLGIGNTGGQADVRIDNVYVDLAGANLTNPVPEPTSLATLGLGAAMLLRRRRK